MFCFLQRRVTRVQLGLAQNGYSYHHGIPNHEIKGFLLNLLNDINLPDLQKKQAIETYLNKQHIQPIVINNLTNRAAHGDLIYSAFAHNPRNLFHGPRNRSDDPGAGRDMLLINRQSPEYINAFNQYNIAHQPGATLEIINRFANLPQNTAVMPQLDPTTGMYNYSPPPPPPPPQP